MLSFASVAKGACFFTRPRLKITTSSQNEMVLW
jgi:hypothetical protein